MGLSSSETPCSAPGWRSPSAASAEMPDALLHPHHPPSPQRPSHPVPSRPIHSLPPAPPRGRGRCHRPQGRRGQGDGAAAGQEPAPSVAAEGMDPEGPAGGPVPHPCTVFPFHILWGVATTGGSRTLRSFSGCPVCAVRSLCLSPAPGWQRPVPQLCPPPASASCPCSGHVFLCDDKFTVPFHSSFFQRQGS